MKATEVPSPDHEACGVQGRCHVSELELDGLEAADGLPKLLAHSCVLLRRIQAECRSPEAAGAYVDAASGHCRAQQVSSALVTAPNASEWG